MNNAILDFEPEAKPDLLPILRERERECITLIEALDRVIARDEWQEVADLLFNSLVSSLEKQLTSASLKRPLEEHEIYFIQGQLQWAKRYADLSKLRDTYRASLTNIREQIKQNAK